MNDFDFDVKQKKALIPSAKRRKCGMRSKACTLPSDYMTEGEKRKLNGEIVTINMNEPVKYRDLIKASKDVQRQYLKHLQDDYNASVRMLTECLGVSYQTVRNLLTDLGISRQKNARKATMEEHLIWNNFCNPNGVPFEPMQEEAVVSEEIPDKPKVGYGEPIPAYYKDGSGDIELTGLTVTLYGSTYDVCKRIVEILGADSHGRFTVRFFAEGGKEAWDV